MALAYLRDPDEIYRQSFATIRGEAELSRFDAATAEVAIRMIHACGMVDLAADIVASPDFVAAGRAALTDGAPVICDAEMVRHGVIRRLLPQDNDLICLIGEAGVAARAKAYATTRSAAQVDLWGDRIDGAVIAIGNAPTALFRLLELIDAGGPRPAAIVGLPVGFVGAAESKAELAADPRGVPFITVSGRRGGSAMASAVVNALAGRLESHG
jgi:precorrin-8X/cobalt-precorrin-8 methylmutase